MWLSNYITAQCKGDFDPCIDGRYEILRSQILFNLNDLIFQLKTIISSGKSMNIGMKTLTVTLCIFPLMHSSSQPLSLIFDLLFSPTFLITVNSDMSPMENSLKAYTLKNSNISIWTYSMIIQFLPPANELWEGYVLSRVCYLTTNMTSLVSHVGIPPPLTRSYLLTWTSPYRHPSDCLEGRRQAFDQKAFLCSLKMIWTFECLVLILN